ncbi:hypothetical protein [Streptomyces sp. NPDC088736]|uniref:hypothetical protein n=1 Tax=Streptomyces sp. NPDC088736 TaxID=3365881 RepID=UPI00380BAEBD
MSETPRTEEHLLHGALTVHAAELQSVTLAPPRDDIQILGDGVPLVTIHPDGTLTYGPGYTPDEAARRFWDALRHLAPATQATAAIARVRALHSNEDGICGWCKGPDDPNITWDMEHWPCATFRATLDGHDAPAPEFGTISGTSHWRCNGGQGCNGWVGLDLASEDAARREYARHFEQEHLRSDHP